MARKCDLCGKGTAFGNNVSHAKNHTRRNWKPNIIGMKTMIGGTVLTVKLCARCLKSGKLPKVL